ncbi:hypothetical protein [Luteimonas sp. MHLX1A]|uniref:hypothetical protein n=1 Tax=Alterluteimonas muca TaxID=2878684 RepID=UPI001E313CD9|nr:hypothetical protein [Luteimonas sp. MHLX1A]MCD9046770.1 hypothetical protein [Luteimonas sp. MHLX1A]
MTRKTYAPRRRNVGFGLIELMITLGIGLALVAIAVAVSSGVRADSNASKMQTQVLQISSQATTMANGGAFDGMTLATLIRAEKIPNSWIVDNDGTQTVRNPFGGDITLDADGGRLDVISTNVPAGVCTTVVNNTMGSFSQILVGTEQIETDATPAEIANACADSGAPVQMTFRTGVQPAAMD